MMDAIGAIKVKENIVSILMVAAACLIALQMNKARTAEINQLKAEIETENKKNKVLADIFLLEKKLDGFRKEINNKEPASASTFNTIAKDCSVNVSFKNTGRAEPGDFSAYTRYYYELNVSAESYHRIGDFIGRLEKAKEIFIVDSVTFSPPGDKGISARILVSTILMQ